MIPKPHKSYFIDYPPTSNSIDIVPRIQKGIEMAKMDGCEMVFILESDDFYPANYFESFGNLDQYDFVGSEVTLYYNIRNNTYQRFDHKDRSSLFTTGFRISAIDELFWRKLPANHKFLDIDLWQYAKDHRKRIVLKTNPSAVGIKGHGLGLCAGKGHVIPLKLQDKGGLVFQDLVDKEAFQFYNILMENVTI